MIALMTLRMNERMDEKKKEKKKSTNDEKTIYVRYTPTMKSSHQKLRKQAKHDKLTKIK